MNRRTILGFGMFGAFAVSVVGTQTTAAQEQAAGIAANEVRVFSTNTEGRQDTFVFVSNAAPITPFGGSVEWISGMGAVPGAVVTGKPYSAQAITESTQILTDGNRITQRNETRIYRDGQGRTRREQTFGGLGVWQAANEPATTITIHDPVAGTTYMMSPGTETAHAIPSFTLAPGEFRAQARLEPGSGEVVAQIDGLELGSAVPAPVPAPPGAVTRGVRVQTHDVVIEADSGAPLGETFELPVPPPGVAGVARVAAFPPTAAVVAPWGEVTTEELGEQILQGVLARGSRETHTIPAGAIGNERPIAMVMERWYSEELEADVLRRNTDPRFGETTYKLVNVVLGEPSAELFVEPDSYELRTEPNGPFEFKLQHPEGGSVATP